jgi:biotin operon repressor
MDCIFHFAAAWALTIAGAATGARDRRLDEFATLHEVVSLRYIDTILEVRRRRHSGFHASMRAAKPEPPAVKSSLSDQAFSALEEMIVTLKLPPGSLWSEAMLSESLGIGRTPVREAVQRLAEYHLVLIIKRHGIRIAEVNEPRRQSPAPRDRRASSSASIATRAARRAASAETRRRWGGRQMAQAPPPPPPPHAPRAGPGGRL